MEKNKKENNKEIIPNKINDKKIDGKEKSVLIENNMKGNKNNNSFEKESNDEIKNKTIVFRQKPSFRELREKVLHRTSSSYSAFI